MSGELASELSSGPVSEPAGEVVEELSSSEVESAIEAGKISVWEGADPGAAVDAVAGQLAGELNYNYQQMLSDERHGSISRGDRATIKVLRDLARKKIQYAEQ